MVSGSVSKFSRNTVVGDQHRASATWSTHLSRSGVVPDGPTQTRRARRRSVAAGPRFSRDSAVLTRSSSTKRFFKPHLPLSFDHPDLKPVFARYRGTVKRLYFPSDAAFANLEIYQFLEVAEALFAVAKDTQQRDLFLRTTANPGNVGFVVAHRQ